MCETYGALDILVNSAGICNVADVDKFGRAQWDPMIALNLTAAFELSHEASKPMIGKRRARSSTSPLCSPSSAASGRRPTPPPSTASPDLPRPIATNWLSTTSRSNAIAPGYFVTAMTRGDRSNPETNQRVLDHIPAGRWGDPADLMGATVFLASRASDYVNGHVLVVDGGYLVR